MDNILHFYLYADIILRIMTFNFSVYPDKNGKREQSQRQFTAENTSKSFGSSQAAKKYCQFHPS